MDSAFKRRWNWKYTSIVDAGMGFQIDIEGAKYNWWKFVDKMNNIIEDKIESEDKKLGYFFACNSPIIDADCFVSKVLFYLWNDVFKDADLDGTPFKEHSFYKLFNADGTINNEEVMNFLGDKPLELEWERKAIQKDDDNKKPNTRYSINGDGSYAMMTIPFNVLSMLYEQSPYTLDELISKWSDFNVSFLLTEEEYNQRCQETPNSRFASNYTKLPLLDEKVVYVNKNCWTTDNGTKFIAYVKEKYPDNDIDIQPIEG